MLLTAGSKGFALRPGGLTSSAAVSIRSDHGLWCPLFLFLEYR